MKEILVDKSEKTRSAHIIISQGYYPEFTGQYRMQPWVENINSVLSDGGYKLQTFSCGNNAQSFKNKDCTVTISKKIDRLVDPFSVGILSKLIFTKKPDIAVIHGLQHILSLFSIVIYSLRRVPIILFVHGIYSSDSNMVRYRDCLLKLVLHFKKSILLVALTDIDKHVLLEEWGLLEDDVKVTFAHLSITEEERLLINNVQNANIAGNKQKHYDLLYIGRLSKEKQVEMLIYSVNALLSKGCFVRLLVIGDGPEKKSLVNLTNQLGLTNQIDFLGAINHRDIWQYLISSDVLVLPSKKEGFGRVVLEAMSCGTPVLVSNACGSKQVVLNRCNGFVFNTSEELTATIQMILSDKALYGSLKKFISEQKNTYLLCSKKHLLTEIFNDCRINGRIKHVDR